MSSALVDLAFEQVSFSYSAVPVLRDISFHIHRGEFVAMVGPNGAGKSTVLKLALGLETPCSGRVLLFGRDPALARDRVGFVPQSSAHDLQLPVPVREVVRMGLFQGLKPPPKRSEADVEEAMGLLDVAHLAEKNFTALSGGERRRVLVARALVSRPDFLILDEPTANMDEESQERLYRILSGFKGRVTVLMVTHDWDFVSGIIDRALCVGEGRVVRHELEPASAVPPGRFGGRVLRVRHERDLPADDCCSVEEGRP